MIFRQKAMLRTAIRPKRKVVAGRTLRSGVARRGYRGVPVDDFRASFPLPGMTLSVVLGRTPWRATRESCTDCREYMPLPPFVSPRPAEDVPEAAGGAMPPSAWAAAAEERIFRNCILAGLRPAGSHCEKRGKIPTLHCIPPGMTNPVILRRKSKPIPTQASPPASPRKQRRKRPCPIGFRHICPKTEK